MKLHWAATDLKKNPEVAVRLKALSLLPFDEGTFNHIILDDPDEQIRNMAANRVRTELDFYARMYNKNRMLMPEFVQFGLNPDRKLYDAALTYMANIGAATNNQNLVQQCALLIAMNNARQEFGYGDKQLLKACLERYYEDIPKLLEVNPEYKKHEEELLKHRERIPNEIKYYFSAIELPGKECLFGGK